MNSKPPTAAALRSPSSSAQAGSRVSHLLLACFLAALLGGCGGSSIEDQVKARIDTMEAAGEAGDRSAFMDGIAEDFQGRNGSMTRVDFVRYMLLQINQRQRVSAQVFPVTVTIRGTDLADASFRLLLTGGRGMIPEEGRLLDVETQWIYEDGDWRLWRADWDDATP